MKRIISILLTIAMVLASMGAISGVSGSARASETDESALAAMRKAVREEQREEQAEAPLPDDDEIVELIVELRGASSLELAGGRSAVEAAQDEALARRVESAQDSCIRKILKINPKAEITQRYGLLLNGFSVKTRYGDKAEIEALAEVESVILANTYTRSVSGAQQAGGIPQVREDYGYDGRNVVVAVIDSGIDYNHKDMVISAGVPVSMDKSAADQMIATIGHGQYFTEKVPYGYNYADKNNDIIDRAVDDPAYNHGMHVAGIIGGNCQDEGAIANYSGIRGVAPECQLLAMKIFSNDSSVSSGSEADIIAAIEDAVALGADVINLSIGLSAGFHNPENGQQKAIKAAREAGVIVVAAAGNGATSDYLQASGSQDGSNYDSLIDIGTIAEPGLADDAIQVASADNSWRIVRQLTAASAGKTEELPYILSDFDASTLSGQYPVVYCGLGRLEDLAGKDLTGKVALVERGEIEFQEKKLNVQGKGAVAAIIYNREGDDTFLDFISTSEEVKIPTVFMRNCDGKLLRTYCDGGLKVDFRGTLTAIPQGGGGISYFSSWGPNSDLTFKPDLTAVGGYVWSTIGGNAYQTMSGTSMACPNVAGMAALMVQHMDTAKIETDDPTGYVKNALMNTAHILLDGEGAPWSPRAQGAGMADLADALANSVTVTCAGDPFIELKVLEAPRTVRVELYNGGDEAVTYAPAAIGDAAGCVSFGSSSITVEPGTVASVDVTFAPDMGRWKDMFVEGFIRFETAAGEAPAVGLPFMGFCGDWGALQVLDTPMYEDTSVYQVTGLYTSINHGYITQTIPLGDGIYPQYCAINPADPDSYCNVMPEVSFLRNARDVTVDVADSAGEVIKVLDHVEYVRKEVPIEQSVLAEVNFNWLWSGTYYDKQTGEQKSVDEGQYYINIRARADYENSGEQTLTMPVKVDRTAPTVEVRTSFIQSEMCRLEITAKDLGVVDGGIHSFVFLVDGTPYEDADGKSVFDLKADADGKYYMDLPITGGEKDAIHTVDIGVTDYTNNMGAARAQVVDTSASKLTVDAGTGQFLPGEPVEVRFSWEEGSGAEAVSEYRIYVDSLSNLVGTTEDGAFTLPELLPSGAYTIIVQAVNKAGQVFDTNYAEVTVGGQAADGKTLRIEQSGDSTLEHGELFTAEIKVANLGDTAEQVSLILCLYDEQMRMVDSAAVERDIAPGAVEQLTGSVAVPETGRYTAKIMVWDSIASMESLMPYTVIEM